MASKRRPAVRIALDCFCGDTARGGVSSSSAYEAIKAAFVAVHSGHMCRVMDLTDETTTGGATPAPSTDTQPVAPSAARGV